MSRVFDATTSWIQTPTVTLSRVLTYELDYSNFVETRPKRVYNNNINKKGTTKKAKVTIISGYALSLFPHFYPPRDTTNNRQLPSSARRESFPPTNHVISDRACNTRTTNLRHYPTRAHEAHSLEWCGAGGQRQCNRALGTVRGRRCRSSGPASSPFSSHRVRRSSRSHSRQHRLVPRRIAPDTAAAIRIFLSTFVLVHSATAIGV